MDISQQLQAVSKKTEIYYCILNESTNFDNEYEKMISKFLLEDNDPVEEILVIRNEKQSFVASSHIEQQQWITFAVHKFGQEIFLLFVQDKYPSSNLLHSYKMKQNEINQIIKNRFPNNFSIQVIENKNQDEYNENITFTQAFAFVLHKMNIIYEFLKDKNLTNDQLKQKFQQMNFSIDKPQEIISRFEKIFVKQGLAETSIGKKTLEIILVSLKYLLKNDKDYLLEEEQLNQLTNILKRKNFSRENDSEVDLKEIILNILFELKNRGQKMNNLIIQNYYEQNSTHFDKIEEFDGILKQNSRDNQTKGCMIIALNYQKEFLFSVAKLFPSLKSIDEFIQLLDEHYHHIDQFQIRKMKLQNEFNSFNSNEQELVQINFKISKIQKQLDYYLAKAEINKSIDIDDLVILLGENLIDQYKFSQGTIDKLIEISKRTENNDKLALVLIKIFENIYLNDEKQLGEIDKVLNKLISQISQSEQNVEIIVNLRHELLKNLNQNLNLVKFLHEILIENQHLTNRTKALDILKSLQFYPNQLQYIKQIIQLEEKSLQNDSTFVDDCLKQVQNRNKLTWNLFEKLMQFFPEDIQTIEQIVQIITEESLQKLPEVFIRKFEEQLKSLFRTSTSTEQKNMICICKLLIKAKYVIDLNEIQPTLRDLLSMNEDENLLEEILEMIFAKFSNGDDIEKEMIEKIQLLADKSQYAQNLMKFIAKNFIENEISILKNFKNDFTTRKEALNRIIGPSISTVHVLESIIIYDSHLRADAFKKLAEILADDCQININEIAETIHNEEKICVKDISKFVYKIKQRGNTLLFLPAIIYRYRRDQQTSALKLLKEMSSFTQQQQGKEFLQNLLDLAEDAQANQIQSELIGIIENFINNNQDLENVQIQKQKIDNNGKIEEIQCLLIDELNRLKRILSIDEKTLENLSLDIQQRNIIVTHQQTIQLIEALTKSENNLNQKIIDLLIQIDLAQDLNEKTITFLYNTISQNLETIAFSSLLRIIDIGLRKNRQIPDQIIEILWKQSASLSNTDTPFKYNFVYTILLLVTQEKSIPQNVLEELVNNFKNQQEDIRVRILIAKIFLTQIKYNHINSFIIQSLKEVALQTRNNQNEDFLNRLVFRSLKEHFDDEFLNNFYNEFKIRLTTIDKTLSIKPITQFLQGEKVRLKKFQLLNALNIQFSSSQKLDTNIFTEFHPDDWTKEILASQLISEIFQIKQNHNQGIDEFQLEKFRQYIQLVTNHTNFSIQDLLEILIVKQNTYEFDLEKVNDIFFLLTSQQSIDTNETQEILQNHSAGFYFQLQRVWLAKQLQTFHIAFTKENLFELNRYLTYKPEIIHLCFVRLDQFPNRIISIDELIHFFIVLANSGFTKESNQSFLFNELTEKTTTEKLLIKLGEKVIGQILSDKFSFYQDYLQTKTNYKTYRLLAKENHQSRKNAYNQAHTTEWYTAEDIALITSQWMKEFNSKQIRITQALGQQDNLSLTTILNQVLNEYKQENNQICIIPLNIAGSHWVTVAIVHTDKQHTVLYKDSFGEENQIEERKHVEQIFRAADLTNVRFKYNRSREQFDDYNCGIFALGNMKIMAQQLTSTDIQKDFIENFENYAKFVDQDRVIQLRKEIFPSKYALSSCESLKRIKIIDHHTPELNDLRKLLRQISTGEDTQFDLSIALPQEENLSKENYDYLYVIKLTHIDQLKEKLISVLHIKEIYEEDQNFIKILDKNLIELARKEKKLNPIELKIDENNIENLLIELDVNITEYNKEVLRDRLGLSIKNSSVVSTSSNKESETIDSKQCELLYELHQKLTKMLTSTGWFLKSIVDILFYVDSKLKLERLVASLDPIYEYNLREYDQNMKGKNIFEILRTNSSDKWITEIHSLAIFQTFKGSHVKDFDELIKEIFSKELNKQHNLPFCQDEKFLCNEYKHIITFYENEKSQICSEFNLIKEWKTDEIKQWSEKLKSSSNKVNRHEIVAIIKRAVEITSSFPPREIQLLSLIILLNPKKNLGRLAQINTGEGKTTIVAMLAAIKALEGHQVDIVTSSPELAKPQSKEQKKFFQLFGLTCAHNGQDSSIDIKERYRADIVYGAASDFQGDILRDEYNKLCTRQDRKCDVAIVDEVDSMLIDGKNHIVMLSSSMPAMDHLEPILAAIWIQIEQVSKSIREIDGKWYFIDPGNLLDEHGKIRSDLIEHAFCIQGTKEQFIKDSTEKHIRKLIRDEKENIENYPEIQIPKHLRELVVKSQLDKWISSAIHAKYRCKNKQDYIIKNGKIAPIDAHNTGIVQQNMNWNDGLHQFLQLKHGAKLTPENFTTNFISNVTYFKRYSPNLFGLTGTLGSTNARQLLNETYEVDNVIIPPFKAKQYRELTPIICDQENDWYMNIVGSSMNKLKNGRGVLIITKYIQQVEEIRNRLIDAGCNLDKIKIYKTEEDSLKAVQQELKHGEIIIATNIAGRGTDIRASDTIENNGGLHVCVTFLPTNERVEQQNVGRTSRTGHKGTGQFILFIRKSNDNFKTLKRIRDQEEENGLESAKKQINKVLIKDEIFALFCDLLNEIDEKDTEKAISKIKLRAVEERFGIWLKMEEKSLFDNNQEQINKDQIKDIFEKFRKQILADKQNNRLILNPYFHVLIGNEYLGSKKCSEAIEEYSKAIILDEDFQVNAFYNRGYARIVQYGNDINHEQIDEAIKDFKQAKKIIEEHFEPLLNIIQQASTDSKALSEQVTHKMTLYGVQKNTIEMAIGQDIKSQIKVLNTEKQERRDATERRKKETDEQLKNLEKEKNQTERINELKKEKDKQENTMIENEKAIVEQIKKLQENQEAKELGIIGQAKKSGRSIEIEFVDIDKSLPEDEDISLYKEEIQEYKNNGFRGTFKIKEIKPIDWKSVISVAALGIAQLVGGAAIAVFSLGAGATVGMGLIFEGVSDLITAVKDGIINRDFSWVSYGIQKAISLTVSLVCAGMGAIKDAAKTAVAGIKQAAALTKTVVTTVTKTGWRLAAKAIGTNIAKGVAKELVTQLVDYGVNKALMPSIETEIMKLIEKPIQEALMKNDCVMKMLKLDGIHRKRTYEMLIKNKALELLNPRQPGENNALITIAEGVAKGIASNKIPGLSTITQIKEAVEALNTLGSFLDKFLPELDREIKNIFEKDHIQDQLDDFDREQQATNMKKKPANTKQKQNDVKRKEEKTIENNPIITTSNYNRTGEDDGDIDTSQNIEHEEQVKVQRADQSSNELRQSLAQSVSTNMCNIIKGKLITPVTHIGINHGMNKLTQGLDKSIQEEIGTFQAERRIEFFQNGDKDNRIPEEYKHGAHDQEALKEADARIKELQDGGEAGLYHLGTLSDVIGRPIKVLDEEGKVIRIIGSDKGGEPIEAEYHKPKGNGSQGHWTLPGGKEPSLGNTGQNNCLFNVIAEQTTKDATQLRIDAVIHLDNNKANLANQVRDIQRLEQYKKDALIMGGWVKEMPDFKGRLIFAQGQPITDKRPDVVAETISNDLTSLPPVVGTIDGPGIFIADRNPQYNGERYRSGQNFGSRRNNTNLTIYRDRDDQLKNYLLSRDPNFVRTTEFYEYDIQPDPRPQNRGGHRVVMYKPPNGDTYCFYTWNHYEDFFAKKM